MANRTRHRLPELDPALWMKSGEKWVAIADSIRAKIASSGYSESDIRRNLGAAYDEFLEALKGKPVGIWTASFIESAIKPREPYHLGLSSPTPPFSAKY